MKLSTAILLLLVGIAATSLIEYTPMRCYTDSFGNNACWDDDGNQWRSSDDASAHDRQPGYREKAIRSHRDSLVNRVSSVNSL